MNVKKDLLNGENQIKGIFSRIRRRDFSGNSGQAIKNSTFQLATNLVAKIGSLFFTIIIARLLMPELFGLYSLALATILMFSAISNLGSGQVLIKFVSEELGKGNLKNAKKYSKYFFKVRIFLLTIAITTLLICSKFLANSYYQKPIFLALLAGAFYLLAINIMTIFESLLMAQNNFKNVFFKELFFQIIRLIILPLSVIYFISLENSFLTALIIISLSVCFYLAILFILFLSKKDLSYLSINAGELNLSEKKEFNHFLFVLSITSLTGMFFSYIDMFFLGRFVSGEMIGFYSVATSLVGAAIPLISFAGALLPIFSRLDATKSKHLLNKSLKITLLISIPTIIFSVLIASYLIRLVYGSAYLDAVFIFRVFTILFIISPLVAIYTNFHISQNNPSKVTRAVILSTLINLLLNGLAIYYLVSIGASQYSIVLGVTFATIISKIAYLINLMIPNKSL